MSLREEVAFEVYRSSPSCDIRKECNTECGTCGADRILSLIIKRVRAMGGNDPIAQAIIKELEEQ